MQNTADKDPMSPAPAAPVAHEAAEQVITHFILGRVDHAYLHTHGLNMHGITFPDPQTVRVHLYRADGAHLHLDTPAHLSSPTLLAYRTLRRLHTYRILDNLDTDPTCETTA